MRPKREPKQPQHELFQVDLEQLIDMNHSLVRLGLCMDWASFEQTLGATYHPTQGAPGISTRLMVALHYLKYRERYPNPILRSLFASVMIESWRTTRKHHGHVGEFLYRIKPQAAKAWRHSVVSAACATGSSTIGRSVCAGPRPRRFSPSR